MKQKRTEGLSHIPDDLVAEQENLRVAEEDLAEKSEALWKIQADIEAESERYKALYECAPDPYILTDEFGVIQEANQATSDLLGIEPEFLRGKILIGFVDSKEHTVFRNNLSLLRRESDRLEWEVTLNLHKHQARYAVFSVSRVRNSHRRSIVLGWLIRDITEHRQAEAMRAQLAAIVTASQDAIIGYSPDGIIQSWNRGAEQIFGYCANEIVGRSLSVLASPIHIEEQKAFIKGVLAGESIVDRETVRRRKDGSLFPASLTLSPIQTESGNIIGISAIIHDITARKQAEAQRQRQYELITEQERRTAVLQERNRLAQEIHDGLAQTLLGISLQVEAIRDEPGMPKGILHCLERIQQSARSGLAESRRAMQALRPGLLEDHTLAEALTYIAAQITLGSGMEIVNEVTLPPVSLPVEVEADLFRIAQEALQNAVRHSRASRIRLELRGTDTQVYMGVEDDGCGFDVNAPTIRYGLVGIRERAKRLGGELKLLSAPGCGTKLHITVPTGA